MIGIQTVIGKRIVGLEKSSFLGIDELRAKDRVRNTIDLDRAILLHIV